MRLVLTHTMQVDAGLDFNLPRANFADFLAVELGYRRRRFCASVEQGGPRFLQGQILLPWA